MAYRFQCVMQCRDIPREYGTIQGLDNEEYLVREAVDGTVYQLHADGRRSPVALLQSFSDGYGEIYRDMIVYSGGRLSYSNYQYDMFPPAKQANVYSHSPDGPGFVLHKTYEWEDHDQVLQDCRVEYAGVQYPVHLEQDGSHGITAMTVFRPNPADPKNLVPIARLTCTVKKVWDIEMDRIPYPILGMAICALPRIAP